MKQLAFNVGLLVVALAVSVTAALWRSGLEPAPAPLSAIDPSPSQTRPFEPFLRDAGGRRVPLHRYQRIVSTSWLADGLLAELAEPDRVLALTTSSEQSPHAYRLGHAARIDGMGPLEPILALKPDLVLASALADPNRAARLNDAGVPVFDLGAVTGLDAVAQAARAVATLLGAPQRGERFALALKTRMARIVDRRADARPRRAIYVGFIAGHMFGGTLGTSYHDVLLAAGLDDVAAQKHAGWPEYSTEELMEIAPEVIVTKTGMRDQLCRAPGLATLAACHDPGGVVELPGVLLEDPGPAMLDAAEMLYAQLNEGR